MFEIATEGDWEIVLVVADRSGRVEEYPLTPIGGGDEVYLKIRPAGSNTVANPTITIVSSSGILTWRNYLLKLKCSTIGATIQWQKQSGSNPPTVSWTNYTGQFYVCSNSTVYARAIKTGMTNSATVSKALL